MEVYLLLHEQFYFFCLKTTGDLTLSGPETIILFSTSILFNFDGNFLEFLNFSSKNINL